MAINFHSPSYRASSSDLTVAISPLGLVELADEEFEIHGPRLNRYSHNWAFYLGHHWAYRRPAGEVNLTFNYVKAFADFINNFTFGRGVNFHTPKETEAIVPGLLQRVWEVDNNKESVLWEMGNQGGVSGDCFVKVAYEEPFVDSIGRAHPGRVRILPLNASHCFPEFHPHDRSRLIRFKLKYRFWGTAAEGTRQVYTYTELLTENQIEEYVNDELLNSRPNPLGVIPIVAIPNTFVSGSPWGLSDVMDITSLNREFNEKATEVSDIINYHAAPVTIISGAKSSQLEKGPRKVWGGLPKDAKVYNLELGGNLSAPLAYLEQLKRGMHEMTGVPETALGQRQPISNTSGVALAIQYQPLMNRYSQKKMQYGLGIQRINELVLLTLAIKEPWTLQYNPTTESDLKPGQRPVLDPADPLMYRTTTSWPPPLPVDVLVKLNEIEGKMRLGLESKRGALRELGHEFPDEKMAEVFDELMEDLMEQGALDLRRSEIGAMIATLIGVPMEGEQGDDVQSAGGSDVTHASGENTETEAGGPGPMPLGPGLEPDELFKQLVTRAYGTKAAQRRNPTNTD